MDNQNWKQNLSALPEVDVLENTQDLVAIAHIPDDPFMFVDADGVWFVVYGLEGGPYKRRA